MGKKILVVDDEKLIVKGIRFSLEQEGMEVDCAYDGEEALEYARNNTYDMVLLDVMLPQMDGIELLKRLKESEEYRDIPVIMATAKGEEYDRIKGLDLGADDYIVKPFSMMEMVSRVKAVLRRSQPQKEVAAYCIGGLRLDLEKHIVEVDENRIQLTYKEFELLRIFLSHPGKVYAREQLFVQVWNTDYMGDSRTLDMHIRTLRQKLGDYGKMIETVRNVGYRLEVNYDKKNI